MMGFDDVDDDRDEDEEDEDDEEDEEDEEDDEDEDEEDDDEDEDADDDSADATQEEVPLPCPYCASVFSIVVDKTGGQRQRFTTDCEVCCRPIEVTASIDEDGVVELEGERESD